MLVWRPAAEAAGRLLCKVHIMLLLTLQFLTKVNELDLF